MITITLHEEDAAEALRYLHVAATTFAYATAASGPPEPNPKLFRAINSLRCALLLCDCDKVGKEKEG